jgi:hypothetical protein
MRNRVKTRQKKITIQEREEIACIRAYDAAMASGETPIPYEQVIEKIASGWGRISRSGPAKKLKSRRDAGATT